jgi:nucleoside-diphosphate-sugar epimerase
MRVIIAGGTGVVGGSVGRAFLQQEIQVRVLAGQNSGTGHLTAERKEMA